MKWKILGLLILASIAVVVWIKALAPKKEERRAGVSTIPHGICDVKFISLKKIFPEWWNNE